MQSRRAAESLDDASTRRQAGAEYLLLDSGAQLHAFPIKYQDEESRCLTPRIHTVSGARLQHDGGRLVVTFKLPEGRTVRVLFHACEVQQPILSLVCLDQQEYWSDFRADTGTLFFLDKIQTQHSQTQLHKGESLFFVKGMLMAPSVTAGVSDDVAQELQMPIEKVWRNRCHLVLPRSKIQTLLIKWCWISTA